MGSARRLGCWGRGSLCSVLVSSRISGVVWFGLVGRDEECSVKTRRTGIPHLSILSCITGRVLRRALMLLLVAAEEGFEWELGECEREGEEE